MKSTSSRYADFAAAENRARGHVLVDGKWAAKFVRNPDAQSPAGGVSSTVRDMAQWIRLQLSNGKLNGKQIIDAEALAETHRPQVLRQAPEDPSIDRATLYGLGWNVDYDDEGRVRLSHSGGFNLGAATVVSLYPAEELGIVVLTNASPIGVPEAIAKSFFDLALNGKVDRDWFPLFRLVVAAAMKPDYGTATDYSAPPRAPSSAHPAEVYTGSYANDLFGQIEVVERENGLQLLLGPKKDAFPLKHFNGDVFTYQPAGENAYGPSAVTFTVGAAGKATAVAIENLDVEGQGTFTRIGADN
jgi:CubicO group peptidase (beta-lactamase class C family)